jgi:hypothetical protein
MLQWGIYNVYARNMPNTPSAIPIAAINNGQVPQESLGVRIHLFGPTATGAAYFPSTNQTSPAFYYVGSAEGTPGPNVPLGPVTDEIALYFGNQNGFNNPGQPIAGVPPSYNFLQNYLYTMVPNLQQNVIAPYTLMQTAAVPFGVSDNFMAVLTLLYLMFIAFRLVPTGGQQYVNFLLGAGDTYISAVGITQIDVQIVTQDPSIDNWYESSDTGRYGYVCTIYQSPATGGLVYTGFKWLNFKSNRVFLE